MQLSIILNFYNMRREANLAFTDDLNAVIPGLIATNIPATPCGESSSLSGTSTITLSGGEVARNGGGCTFNVEVLVPASATAGTFTNTTTILTSAGIQVGLPATADLVIEPAPGFSKGFKPNTLDTSGTTPATLTFTVSNFTSALAASELSFTDNLPASITVANPANASTTCTGVLSSRLPAQVLLLTRVARLMLVVFVR